MVPFSRTALAISAALVGVGVVWVVRAPLERADSHFDAHIERPAYTEHRPRVYFDEDWSQGLYEPFLDLIQNDGYAAVKRKGRLTSEGMRGSDILVVTIAMPFGFRDGVKTLPGLRHNLKGDAFTPEECAVVRKWVKKGGALLLACDYAVTAKSADTLVWEFGIRFLDGWAIEPKHHDTETGRLGFIVFSRENGGLLEHPITRGIDRVMSFTGQAMLFPAGATPFLQLSPEARVAPYRENQPRLQPSSAAGAAQGVALEAGRGRVVVLGEATMLTAVRVRVNGTTQRFGMGHAGCDDRQLTLNVMHWLSRL